MARAAAQDVLTAPPTLIVLLQSYDTSSGWEHDVAEGVFTRLLEGGVNADLREEYLDARRHGGQEYLGHLRDVLLAKYGHTPPRLVITCDDAALEFLLANPDVFPEARVVFGGVQSRALADRVPRARMTGVREEFRIDQILETALAARPAARRLFVVTAATPGGEAFREQFAAAAPRYRQVTFVPLSTAALSFDRVLGRLRSDVAPEDLVIAAPVIRDMTGRTFDARLSMPAIVEASRAPVVAVAYDDHEQGLLAVTASTGVGHGRQMAVKALQVLSGAAPATIPIDVVHDSPLRFDARVLARFGIAEDSLPAGTSIVHRTPPTFYEARRGTIWAAAAFIGLQSLIIAGLVLNVVRRRRAEAARDNQARALVSANRALEESNRSLIHEQEERQRIEEDLRHAQKMEAVGRLAGGVAHDFNNLLTVTLGYCELLRAHVRGGSAEFEALEQIRKASEQAATLTHNLLAFSRKQVSLPTTIDVTRTVHGLEPMLRRFCGERVSLTLHLLPDAGCVELGAGQLEQVVMNLVINASDAMPDGGFLEVATRTDTVVADGSAPTGLRPGRHVVLTVTDTGTGMDAPTRARIFEPFFTTKDIGRGTGLGLAIVTQRGGRIAVESTPAQGSIFAVWLPAVACREATSGATVETVPAHVGRTVLVVEDEADLRTLVALLLRNAGYAVLEAASGDEAYLVAAHHDGPIDLLLTDLVMPEQDGFTVARRLRDARPGIAVAYMSGYTERLDVHGDQDSLLLGKPFLPEALFAHVRRALDQGARTR
jgi:signal transduction histidine kinase